MAGRSPFPPVSLEEALLLAKTIWEHNSGHPMRRVTIFHSLNRQPESSTSRQLITASAGYGLTEGSYKSDTIKLTERGRAIIEKNDPQDRLNAVLEVNLFQTFFEQYRDKSVPSRAAALDFLKGQGISEESSSGCFDIILKNGRQAGFIQDISGKERIVSPEHALEILSKVTSTTSPTTPREEQEQSKAPDQTINPAQPTDPDLSAKHTGLSPTLHIDIQIHIAADAQPEQIDQIFASMAKHLYNRN